MKTKLLCLLAVALLTGPVMVYAAPITVSPGDTLLWNFDLSGQTPAPPYEAGIFRTRPTGFDFDDVGQWQFFEDLDGGGSQFDSNPRWSYFDFSKRDTRQLSEGAGRSG